MNSRSFLCAGSKGHIVIAIMTPTALNSKSSRYLSKEDSNGIAKAHNLEFSVLNLVQCSSVNRSTIYRVIHQKTFTRTACGSVNQAHPNRKTILSALLLKKSAENRCCLSHAMIFPNIRTPFCKDE